MQTNKYLFTKNKINNVSIYIKDFSADHMLYTTEYKLTKKELNPSFQSQPYDMVHTANIKNVTHSPNGIVINYNQGLSNTIVLDKDKIFVKQDDKLKVIFSFGNELEASYVYTDIVYALSRFNDTLMKLIFNDYLTRSDNQDFVKDFNMAKSRLETVLDFLKEKSFDELINYSSYLNDIQNSTTSEFYKLREIIRLKENTIKSAPSTSGYDMSNTNDIRKYGQALIEYANYIDGNKYERIILHIVNQQLEILSNKPTALVLEMMDEYYSNYDMEKISTIVSNRGGEYNFSYIMHNFANIINEVDSLVDLISSSK